MDINTSDKILRWLFETKAVSVCPEGRPFWYTSGTIGPYYINTHFLFGSEDKANHFLEIIDREKEDILSCPLKILELSRINYENDEIYRGVVDELCRLAEKSIDLRYIDFISGGERRDWFFSVLVSDILGKPHITIYKDLKTVKSISGKSSETHDLNTGSLLHISDLLNEASSFERAWIPSIRQRNGRLKWSIAVVDRMQGGGKYLESEGVKSLSLISIDKCFFDSALSLGLINEKQHFMVIKYMENPRGSMREFLISNPGFLEEALASGGKTSERARQCIDKDIYGLRAEN